MLKITPTYISFHEDALLAPAPPNPLLTELPEVLLFLAVLEEPGALAPPTLLELLDFEEEELLPYLEFCSSLLSLSVNS